jgi:hypothetical protein
MTAPRFRIRERSVEACCEGGKTREDARERRSQ